MYQKNVKKIGILTFTDGTNYGQRLQNYALQRILEKRGFQVYTIRVAASANMKHKIKRYVSDFCFFTGLKKRSEREEKFYLFNKKWIHFWPRRLVTKLDASKIDQEFDAFVTGSDQVWNPDSPDVNENYFLTFTDRKKRMAYAPSISAESIPAEKVKLYSEWLSGFDLLSVREQKGAELIAQMTGQKAHVVLDPTLMLCAEEWHQIAVRPDMHTPDTYILVLFLGEDHEKEYEKITRHFQMKVVQINPRYSSEGPDQILTLIRNANLVLTDSFHISVFSVLFHVSFIVFDRKGDNNRMNSRFASLFYTLNTGDRNWTFLQTDPSLWIIKDYRDIEQALQSEREKSGQYLHDMLGGM